MKRSLPNLIKRDLIAKVRVYIVVEATVIRYDQYDFITGMKVNKIIQAGKIGNFDMVECRNDHVVALMKVKKGIEHFKVGDIIPIRVGQSMYKIGNQHILVNGYPFLPFVPDQVYYTIDELTDSNKEHYKSSILPLIERELKRKETLDKKRWETFSKLLHPFKTQPSSKSSSEVDLMDVNMIQKGLFGIDHQMDMSKLKLSNYKSNSSDSIIVVNERPNIALTCIGFAFVKWIETINNLTEQYNTDADYKSLDHIWDLYSEHKF